jgi:hypothetical protein
MSDSSSLFLRTVVFGYKKTVCGVRGAYVTPPPDILLYIANRETMQGNVKMISSELKDQERRLDFIVVLLALLAKMSSLTTFSHTLFTTTPTLNDFCLWLYSPLLDLGRFFSFLIHTQSVGLLGRGISPSQGRYVHKHRINVRKHQCLEWDSNPRPQCSSGRRRFMP